MNRERHGRNGRRAAFTLLELMVVVAIIGLVAVIGIPAMLMEMHRGPMSKAVNDVVGICSHAREEAILNGVPMLTALKITEQVIPNHVIKEATARTREAVTDGKTLAQPLAQSKIFPQLMVDLVRIGEETGDVPGALNNIADTYENELQTALRVMTDLIGPVLIIVMAVVVGFLLLSIFLPLFRLVAQIH